MPVYADWSVLPWKKVVRGVAVPAYRVHMFIQVKDKKDQVHFGIFDDRDVALKARDMALLKFRADKVHLVQQPQEWMDKIVRASWDSFWVELAALKKGGRKCTGGGEATQELLKQAWAVSHNALANMSDKFEAAVRDRALQIADDVNAVQQTVPKAVIRGKGKKK